MDSLNNPLRYGEGLIGRIDQLQSELLEQARIIGKSAEREERLAARVRELEALVGKAEAEILDLIVVITYADPPKAFNNILCHEARIPVEFIESARATLAKLEKRNADQ